MKKLLSILRTWVVPALLVVLAAALTAPWTYYVLKAANDRDILENKRALVRRLQAQLRAADPNAALQKIWETLETEILSDRAVQSVVLMDVASAKSYWRVRTPSTEYPKQIEQIDQFVAAHPGSALKLEYTVDISHLDLNRLRANLMFTNQRFINDQVWEDWLKRYTSGNKFIRAYVYLDISEKELAAQFWEIDGPLLKRTMAFSACAIIVISTVGIFAYRAWQRVGLVRQSAELAQKGHLAQRGLTAAVLAHEIRNPLAALRFQLHSLRRNAADPPRVDATCDTIDSELSRIQQLVQDYLTHEKAETMRVGPVDLSEAVRTLQSIMGEMLRTTGTQLEVVEGVRDVSVTCDSHALRQVLMNLVLNAQQALGRGGRITLRTGISDGFGTIDVSDTGPGIPEEMRDRLFKPFQTTKQGGTGIGLALVKRFVDNFGGSISVDSKTGVGTTFHLRLPLSGTPRGFQVNPVPIETAPTTTEAAYH